MGRARKNWRSGAKKAKKAANDHEETHKFFNQGELGPPPKETRRARAAPAPKLDAFKGMVFVTADKKKTAVVDLAIAAARDAGHVESKHITPFVFETTGFLRKKNGRPVRAALGDYVRSQCDKQHRSKPEKPWWDGIENIVEAEDEKLLDFVKRKGAVFAVKSCCGKDVDYGSGSGLRKRGTIAFSVEKYGLPEATRLALLESYKTLGLRDNKFLKQLKKLT